jgi:hypothetical protein
MHVIDVFMLFVSSLDLIMLSIGNVICDDKKQHVSEAQEASSGFSSRLRIYGLLGLVWFLYVIREKNIFSIVFRKFLCFVLHFVFGIYNKFVKFLKDLTTISITLKNLIPEN